MNLNEMIDHFSFANNNWIRPVLTISILLWLVFVWKERTHFKSSKFITHVIISLAAISSLALIALQLQIHVKKEMQIAVVLTEGYDQLQLDSLKNTHKKLETYSYKIGEPIIDTDKTASSIFILGNGIRSFDQWQLENIPTTYLGGKELKGITQLNYEYYQIKGNRFHFKGIYENPVENNKLLLVGPGGGTLDSLTLTDEKSQLFELSTDLNITGNFVYHVVEKDTLGTVLTKDILPLTIVEPNPLKILMINGYPTFDFKYLKNYLAETGHQVVVKNKLTTARYKYEYFNMNSKPIVDISNENLKSFDILIIDSPSLKVLSNKQKTILKTVVKELGMGILIQPDLDYFSSTKSISSFHFESEKSNKTLLKEYPKQQLKKYFYKFKGDFSIQTIHNSGSKILSAYERVGSGRIGSTVFQNTFELILNGHAKTYHSFWSKIIKKISKPKTPFVQWNASHNITYKDQPFEFELRTVVPNPIVKSNEGFSIPLKRDLHVKSLWKGKVYPKEKGWKKQFMTQDSTITFQYYVTDSLQWKSIRNFNTIKSNEIQFNSKLNSENSPSETLKEVNPLWFFIIFVICMGYLWLEPKL